MGLRAASYAYFVHLSAGDAAVSFSDNYFDLEPREERTVAVTNERGTLRSDMIELGWR